MSERKPKPAQSGVHPDFDGHLERTLAELTVDERLAWIWEMVVLLRMRREGREGGYEGAAGRPAKIRGTS